jgi:hypothetical protein
MLVIGDNNRVYSYMKRSNRSLAALHIGHTSGGSSLAHK